MFDALECKNACVAWIRNFFEENGRGCSAIVGISGGKDSSIVAALCVEALGKERVIGVLMPCGEQSDIAMAELLVRSLEIKSIRVNIKAAVDGLSEALGFELSEQSRINLPPRIRMAALYAVAQSHNGRVANTCNLSEDWVGYSTRYGDSAGDFSPCSKLTVTELKQIGRALGLPDIIVDKTPSDGLCGKSDEENLGFSYDELDIYIRNGVIDDPEKKADIDRRHESNLFKLRAMPQFDPGFPTVARTVKPYKLGIIVGRFQCFHKGHSGIMRKASELCEELAVFIGSSQEQGSFKNPFSYDMRKRMIKDVMGEAVSVYPLPDIGAGNCESWGEYVLQNVKESCGRYPDVLISGREDRRLSWLSDKRKESIAEIYLPKEPDISASDMRRFMMEDDRISWERCSDEALKDRYDELRAALLAAKDNLMSASI